MNLHRTAIVILVFAIFATLFGFANSAFAQPSQGTITVTPLEDTTTILLNPMMGFQDHNVTRNWWPNSTGYLRSTATCLQNGKPILCGELTWSRINPTKGVYAFSDIDLYAENMKAQKKFMGFRIRTIIDEAAGPTIPTWAAAEGVTKSTGTEPWGGRSSVEIDYHKCSFLDKWDDLVQQLVSRYDNNPTVSFVDIGSYGWYGEWWSGKTVLARGGTRDANDPTLQQSIDTRTRLVKMFTGGSGSGRCINSAGQEQVVSYSYQGFKNKPIIMSRGDEEDVQIGISNGAGIRYDKVGAANPDFRQIASLIAQTWKTKPIMGEFANSGTSRDAKFLTRSVCFAREYHLSQIHNNFGTTKPTTVNLDPLFRELGYRISLKTASFPNAVAPSSQVQFSLSWVNKGTAPAYNRYPLILYFKQKGTDTVVAQVNLTSTDIRKILPADVTSYNNDYTSCPKGTPQTVTVNENVTIPALPVGSYDMYFAFVEPTYQNRIQLALTNKDSSGRYLLGQISVQSGVVVPTNTRLPQGTVVVPPGSVPTNTPSAPVSTAMPTRTNVPPTATRVLATATVERQTIESDNPLVIRAGTWANKLATGPSRGSYLLSDGATSARLTLTFTGTFVHIMYVKGPSLGTFDIQVDGKTVQRVTTADSTYIYGRKVEVLNLTAGQHTVKIVPVSGKIGIDAFFVQK